MTSRLDYLRMDDKQWVPLEKRKRGGVRESSLQFTIENYTREIGWIKKNEK